MILMLGTFGLFHPRIVPRVAFGGDGDQWRVDLQTSEGERRE